MLSWIFRHRQRLAAIYGMVQAPKLPGSLQHSRPLALPPGTPNRPGHLPRRGRQVELRPMPPRVR